MAGTNEDLLLESQRLKDELAQLREMVTTLFSIVFEEGGEEGPEGFPFPEGEDFPPYN